MHSVISHRPSQTLLEAILAIGVILVSVFASTTLIVTTISAGQTSEDKIVAGNLAREGIEIVRGIRDSNWMKRAQNEICTGTTLYDWNFLPTSCAAITVGNYVPVLDSTNYRWSLDTCAPTCNSPVSKYERTADSIVFYTNNCTSIAGSSCETTKFRRTIVITKPNDQITTFTPAVNIDYLDVKVTVTWQNHGDKKLELTERLYDWR